MRFLVVISVLSVLAAVSQAAITREGLKHHLSEVFNLNRYYGTQGNRTKVLNYITDFFQEIVDETDAFIDKQEFTYFEKVTQKEWPGDNIYLILKGSRWGTSADRVSIIGAHHDSQVETYGVNDNGAAMSVLLEAAREIALSKCDRLNSIVFAAFDWEEFGLIGSEKFVNEYLVPSILEKYNISQYTYGGAIIMDTILNYDDTPNTQEYPPGTRILFPEMYKWLKARDFRGDFLLAIGRQDDLPLFYDFTRHWNDTYLNDDDIHETGPYEHLRIELPITGNPSDSWLGNIIRDFFRSDHYYFWEYDGDYTNEGLSALFLTDSANFRGYMRQCYHEWCDNMAEVTTERLDFLRVITTTLITMFTEFSTENPECSPL